MRHNYFIDKFILLISIIYGHIIIRYLYEIYKLYIINLNKLNSKMLGISLPNEVLLKIDRDRGAIPRSRFLLKLIEIAYNTNTIKPQEQFG